MINFRSVKYVISAPDYSYRPKDNLKEVVFLGRSNVGKSTLINTLCSQKIAYSSKSAGKTKLLNYFIVDKKFYLVDSPGYGFTAYGNKEDQNFSKMMENYFDNPLLAGAVMLLDGRRDPNNDDIDTLNFLTEKDVPTILVFTKIDQCKQSDVARCRKIAEQTGIDKVYFSKNGIKIEELRSYIANLL